MTMNDTWGYKSYDTNFKSTETLIRNLIDIASKGGNYLLNIGPDSKGNVPPVEVERLQADGQVAGRERPGDLRDTRDVLRAGSRQLQHDRERTTTVSRSSFLHGSGVRRRPQTRFTSNSSPGRMEAFISTVFREM